MLGRLPWLLALLVSFGLSAATLDGQTATPASSFGWDQGAPDLATANSYTYRIYADGATTGTVVAVKCTGTASPFACLTPVPAFTPGSHTVQFTAGNAAGESPKSALFSFQMVIVPSAPANIRVQ